MQGFASPVNGNRTFSLAGTANGGNLSAHLRQRRHKFPRSADQCAPPIFGRLLRAGGIHDMQRNRTESPFTNHSVKSHNAHCSPMCPDRRRVQTGCDAQPPWLLFASSARLNCTEPDSLSWNCIHPAPFTARQAIAVPHAINFLHCRQRGYADGGNADDPIRKLSGTI